MNSVNVIILTGRLGNPPVVRQVGDTEVANFSIATEHSWYSKTKKNDDNTEGGWEARTTWHRITLWRPGKSIKDMEKGRLVHVQGRYESNSWLDQKSGETRHSMEVAADKAWVIPKGGGAFKTEAEKTEKKEAKAGNDLDEALGGPPENDAPFPDQGPAPF